MKNLFLAATAALALLVSCSKDYDEVMETAKGGVVSVSFVSDDTDTRAFFGATATAEAWEKALNTLTMYVFDSSGAMTLQRTFTPQELAGKTAIFSLPNVTVGASYDFYAVANSVPNNITNKAALLAAIEKEAAQYNGTFAEVTAKAKRAGGFTMSGGTVKAIAAAGASTDVAITLKRLVAKVAIEMTPSPDFGTTYPGALRVNTVTLKGTASQTNVVLEGAYPEVPMNQSATQTSNAASGKFQNLFYIYGNKVLPTGSYPTVTINATYDADGNFSTTGDQVEMNYDVALTGKTSGAFARNGYYRVAVTIKGLTGSDATMTITPSEWETPATQTIEVGA